jgi:hypothetical protein
MATEIHASHGETARNDVRFFATQQESGGVKPCGMLPVACAVSVAPLPGAPFQTECFEQKTILVRDRRGYRRQLTQPVLEIRGERKNKNGRTVLGSGI